MSHIRDFFRYARILPLVRMYERSDVRELIDKDLEEWAKYYPTDGTRRGAIISAFRDPYYRVVLFERLQRSGHKGVRRFYPSCPDFQITCKEIGGGFVPFHSYATIILAKSIGENFHVRQCTTIGVSHINRNDEIPAIGDNVDVGCNACILGELRIGDNVNIGAGAIVLNDVPSDCVVAGNPAKVVKKKYEK